MTQSGIQPERQALEGTLIPFTLAPVPKIRRFRLTSARGIRRELAALYAEFRNGALDADTTRTSAFVLRCLLESLRLDEIERRLSDLEAERGEP